MAKKSLDLLIAVGKKPAPKSLNGNGVPDASISEPDQAGNAMAPGSMEPNEEMEVEEASEEMPNSLKLPAGFKLPDGVEEGQSFTTTIKAKKMGDHLMVEQLGEMAVNGHEEASETFEEEMAEPAEQQEMEAASGMEPESHSRAKEFMKKRNDEKAARKAFQGGY